MWLYQTVNDGKPPVILNDYQLSRNGDHAVTYLKGLKGYMNILVSRNRDSGGLET